MKNRFTVAQGVKMALWTCIPALVALAGKLLDNFRASLLE